MLGMSTAPVRVMGIGSEMPMTSYCDDSNPLGSDPLQVRYRQRGMHRLSPQEKKPIRTANPKCGKLHYR